MPFGEGTPCRSSNWAGNTSTRRGRNPHCAVSTASPPTDDVMAELIIDNEYMRLYFHEAEGIVHHEIRRELDGTIFRDVLTRGAELLEHTGAVKWLSDNRGHLFMADEDEVWAKTLWFPRARAAGWKYWAIVKPESAIGTLNVARLSQNYARLGVEARILSDFDAALSWLKGI